MKRSYAYKRAWKRGIARAVDAIGDLLVAPWMSRQGHPKLENVLVLRLDHLGDVISALPFLEQLRAQKPNARITVAVSPASAVLLRDTPWVTDLLVWQAPWFQRGSSAKSSTADFVQQVRQRRFDAAIDLRGDVRHFALLVRASVPSRVAFANTGGGFLLQREAQWHRDRHVIDQQLAILPAIGLSLPAPAAFPTLQWSSRPEEQQWLSAKVSRPFMAVHPDAGTPAKRWPVAHWQALLASEALAERPIVLCGGDHALGEAIASSISLRNRVTNLMGQTTLSQLVSLLQSADALVSTDSGPAHIAAALGRPTFVLWSGTNEPSVWGPRGSAVDWIRHDVPCQPCGFERCPLPRHFCMEDLLPQEVQARLSSFLKSAIVRVTP